MKRTSLVFVIALMGSMLLNSCSKNQNCECVTTKKDGSESMHNTLIEGRRSAAVKECDMMDQHGGEGPQVECQVNTF